MDPPPPPPWPAHTRKKRMFEREGDQESPPGSGSVGLDLIDALPDAVLCTIILLLPTKDGARTQAVARRWRPLWRSKPLNLVADCNLSGNKRKRVAYVSKILAKHPGPALRFELPSICQCHHGKFNRWLRSQALTDLQELHLDYDGGGEDNLLFPLPPSALRFAPTLRVAMFSCCYFPDLSAQSLNFSHLKQLTMYEVTISDLSAPSLNFPLLQQLTMCWITISGEALHSILSGCLSLQSLLLKLNPCIARLHISSPTLRSFSFSANFVRELVIEDTPCLERLLPLNPGPGTVRVVRAPKLQVLGLLSKGICKLHIGTTVFQEMIAISVTTTMRTVKVLVIESVGPNLDAVIGFLKCFPCLERLYYVISHQCKERENVLKYDPLDPIECLELHLKRVALENYFGIMADVDFAKFFVLNTKVLEQMNFGVATYNCDDKWKSDQHKLLQVDNRASSDARFEFTCSYYGYNGIDDKHTHDLSMADPFERTLL